MRSKKINREYLETLSSAELISLADEYGIDIPDDLSRSLVIGDLLEVSEEMDMSKEAKETITVSDELPQAISGELPESYNETKIDVVIRNPVSLFVYWDFSEVLYKQLTKNHTAIKLRVSFFDDIAAEKPEESFDIQISLLDREQYVLIPGGKKFVRVDLIQEVNFTADTILAVSTRLFIPTGSRALTDFRPGKTLRVPQILRLSGIENLLNNHYNNHRQSFY